MPTRPSVERRSLVSGADRDRQAGRLFTTRHRDDRLTSARGLAFAAVIGVALWVVLIWAAVQLLQRLT